MKITIAKDAGYCFGVRDAVNIAYKTAQEHGQVYMLGHIVHNEQVVEDLSQGGAHVVNDLSEVPEGEPILFRAHGTITDTWEKAREMGMNIVDATCPLVRDIHQEVKNLEDRGYKVLIIGDHKHDEVVGIASQVKDAIVVATPEEAQDLGKIKRAGVVSQSTQTIENVQAIINVLMTKVHDLCFINTICFPTKRNQEQIISLAENCEIVIIIGSFTSANSKRLTQLALKRNKHSYQVTTASDLDPEWFISAKTVGISAGASTPDSVIEEVTHSIEKFAEQHNQDVSYG